MRVWAQLREDLFTFTALRRRLARRSDTLRSAAVLGPSGLLVQGDAMERRMSYAAVAVAVFAVVAALGVIVDYHGFRGGFLPWGVSGLAFAASLVAWQYRRRPLGLPRRVLVLGSILVQA